ncbi:MAG: 23S rRNA (pseudouridine(1915)-N(3))-methyltransferase RlmH [Bacteroidota bacterium]|jgi:ribosomal RNA large subunit methyltransferase H|nr:MAG: 23S rRNA (pseudouridine(1915)-N(3))-methyltransferase RlmH [Bacteroidota bacterium]
MKIKILFVGKTVDDRITSIVDDYLKRIKNIDITIKIVPCAKKKYSVEVQKSEEGRSILSFIDDSEFVAILDDKGDSFTSRQFAEWLERRQTASRNITFVVGGAYGFSNEVYDRADSRISLSKMTFSHQIVRAIFAEQLYRAFTIIAGLPYHHE